MASPFSFHCIVCFEEFDNVDRYPVVLNCGHTYICYVCATRLDKCMECRAPLVEKPLLPVELQHQNQLPLPASQRHRTQERYLSTRGRQGGPLTPRFLSDPPIPRSMKQPPPKRLPLPKNVVLLSLMEATEMATEDPGENSPVSPLRTNSSEDEGAGEEEKIRAGTSIAVGVCGTYAVAAKEGLLVYPSRPMKQSPLAHDRNESTSMSEEDVDTLVRFFHMDNKMDLKKTASADDAHQPHTALEPGMVQLRRGDRVQIVSTEDGWAKLARGYGFVRAGARQLVKVGAAVDKACTLEAMLRALSKRRRQLRKEQNQVDSEFVALMNGLQQSLMKDEDLTVIGGDTFTKSGSAKLAEIPDDEEFDTDEPDASAFRLANMDRPPSQNGVSPRKDVPDLSKPHRLVRTETPPALISMSRNCFSSEIPLLGCSTGGDVVEAPRLPKPSNRSALRQLTASLSFEDDPLFSSLRATSPVTQLVSSSHVISREGTPVRDSPPPPPYQTTPPTYDRERDISQPSPRALSAGARKWREKNGKVAATGIDFRTGLSGHKALTSSTQKHPHELLRSKNLRSVKMMSSHAGLSIFPFSRRPQPRAPLETMPSFATVHNLGDEHKENESDDQYDNRTL